MGLANNTCTNGREDHQESPDWFGEVSERLSEEFRNPEFVCEKYHLCMLSTNVNQYLAFRPPHWTWWVYEWGAQVRKHKYGKSPYSKQPSSSKESTVVPSNTTKFQKDIITLYSTILQYAKDPQDLQDHTTKTLLDQHDPHGLLFTLECNYDRRPQTLPEISNRV
jgi:hypothetical protein